MFNFFNPKRNRAIAGVVAIILVLSMVVTSLMAMVVG